MEDVLIVFGVAVIIISGTVIPFYAFLHLMMRGYDGSDKTKQYRKD